MLLVEVFLILLDFLELFIMVIIQLFENNIIINEIIQQIFINFNNLREQLFLNKFIFESSFMNLR
jgi:hypothetical protein